MALSILIVDDERDACDILGKLLRSRGFHVDTAYDGSSALKLSEENSYVLAIIDYRMPDMNGVELFHRLREQRSNVRGIFLTGYTTVDVVFPAIFEGIHRVLSKPVDFSELNTVIDEIVGVTA